MTYSSKPSAPRIRRRPLSEETGLNPGETIHLRRACVVLLSNLSDKQLTLMADNFASYLSRRQAIFDMPMQEVEANVPFLRKLATDFSARPPRPTMLDKRLSWLAKALGLSATDRAILAVIARQTLFASWRELFEMLPIKGHYPSATTIALMSGLPLADIDRCLSPGSLLLQSHMLRDDRDGEFSASDLFKRIIRSHARQESDLLAWLAPSHPESVLQWPDFAHLGDIRTLAARILSSDQPVSILLHGAPGTGKSAFPQVLADQVGRQAVFAGLSDGNGPEPSRGERLGHLLLLRALCRTHADRLIVMDEADEVLTLNRYRGASKQWVNRMVEKPAVPTIWIVNDQGTLDPATLRRMMVVIGFDRPPPPVRARIVTRLSALEGMELAPADQQSLAALPASPAILASGLRAAHLAKGGVTEARLAVSSILKAMGHDAEPQACHDAGYDPGFSSADMDLADLAIRLHASPDRGWSLLLSGPSGTGKSAYARHLAQSLGLEVEERRGSDLLAPHIGETEARIAAAFAQARVRGAMLLIDEADSFLFRRDAGRRSWEISLVNEMLRQMEHLKAPFVATTNLADLLDPAMQRRFTLRATFRAMTQRQAMNLFARRFDGGWPPNEPVPDGLTPGDFAVVCHRARLLGETCPHRLIHWLCQEAEARGSMQPRPIGFSLMHKDPRTP